MKLSLSTNWCSRQIESGEEIAEMAVELGFDELELGYSTTARQLEGFKRRLDIIPVGSVHAFAPVPISAPYSSPELYQLASLDEEMRKLAQVQILRTVRFASELGADTVVLHAGRVMFGRFLRPWNTALLTDALTKADRKVDNARYQKLLRGVRKVRTARSARMMAVLRTALERLVPELERFGVSLALENMPYYEGVPLASEAETILGWGLGERVKLWYDTGHARVAACHGWTDAIGPEWLSTHLASVAGMHLNDVNDLNDDHLEPGAGKVDFAALAASAKSIGHLVFEPCSAVGEADVLRALGRIRSLWSDSGEGDAVETSHH